MVTDYKIIFARQFFDTVEQWNEDEQNVLLGLRDALSIHGMDVICGARFVAMTTLTVEFIEPGETPDMVWARCFLDLGTRQCAIKIHQRDNAILLDGG